MERRLAAILAADVAGFSRLTGADEEGTLARLAQLRSDVVDPAIADHGGRVFKSTGDGVLAAFPSVVEAVRCAARIQQTGGTGRAQQVQPLLLRIGVHVGDVVVAGEDLLGDGVNIAARLEQLAEPGGVCMSGAVHEQVRDRLATLPMRDGGEHSLRNIARPVHVWHVVLDGTSGARPMVATTTGEGAQVTAPFVSAHDRPSLAVLPFANLGGDPNESYFADGITEDITTALSRFRGLLVIARTASFAMRGRDDEPRRVGAELGAEYLLRGSVRRAGERVRVAVQLVEAASGEQLWAERFDRTLADVLDVQDEIADRIVAAVAPQIREAEIQRARRPGRTFSRSYDLALRAQAICDAARREGRLEAMQEALALARAAVACDPVSPRAFQSLAVTSIRVSDLTYHVVGELTPALQEAKSAAERLAELEPGNHMAYVLLAHVAIHTHRGDEARRLLHRAEELNPNDPLVTQMLSWAEANDGLAEPAIRHARDALARTPVGRDRRLILWTLALALWVAGDPRGAIPYAREAIAGRGSYVQRFGVLIACLAELGELDEARRLIAQAQESAPDYVRSRLEGKSWFTRPELAARYAAALRKAAGLEGDAQPSP
jgi:adenylate cyclase